MNKINGLYCTHCDQRDTSTLTMPRIPLKLWQKFAALALFPALFATQAKANFQVCNQTLDVINVAVGQWDVDVWETSGWWIIGPNQCANVIEETLQARYVYVYARDVFNNSMFEGGTTMCIGQEEFRIRGQENCLRRGKIAARFQEVDTRRSERWTFNIVAPVN
jgi:uncharacterized membrane protein